MDIHLHNGVFRIVSGLQSDEGIQPTPKIIRSLATSFVVQVSCGYKHCLALTNSKLAIFLLIYVRIHIYSFFVSHIFSTLSFTILEVNC